MKNPSVEFIDETAAMIYPEQERFLIGPAECHARRKLLNKVVRGKILEYPLDERFRLFAQEIMLLRLTTVLPASERHPFSDETIAEFRNAYIELPVDAAADGDAFVTNYIDFVRNRRLAEENLFKAIGAIDYISLSERFANYLENIIRMQRCNNEINLTLLNIGVMANEK